MSSVLYRDFAEMIWGNEIITEFEISQNQVLSICSESDVHNRKIRIAKERIHSLLVFDLVKFVGISGSVAARTENEEDDIDIFVVVNNDTAWIYRFLIWLKNLRSNYIRREKIALGKNISEGPVKDKFCVNFIVEERAINKMGHSEFVLHELYSLIPIYRENYKNYIISKNDWLVNNFNASEISKVEAFENFELHKNRRNYLYLLINFVLFLGQIAYQMIHLPNMNRVFNNYRKGIIAYFPKEFKGYTSEV